MKDMTITNGNGMLTTDRYEISDKWLNVATKGLDLLRFIVEADFQTTRMEHDRLLATEQMKYDYLRQTDIPGKTFSERSEALTRAYAVLDKATEEGDKELIKASMELIGKIVATGSCNKTENTNYIAN